MAKIKHKDIGEELDSTEWTSPDTHEVIEGGELVVSKPPDGFTKVQNIYLKEVDKEVILIT